MSSEIQSTRARGQSEATPRALQTLSEATRLFWSVADRYVKGRLILALALVAGGALLASSAPVALKVAIDFFTKNTGAESALIPVVFVALYVVGQYLSRLLTELRTLFHGKAEQRLRRHLGRRLFEHLVRLPLRFHLERKTGAIGDTAEQGLRGYELVLHHLVFTLLPVIIEFLVVAWVLVHFNQAKYLWIICVGAAAYVVVFYRAAVAIHEPSLTISTSHIETHSILTDALLNHETVKFFDAESLVCSRYDKALGQTESAWGRFFSRLVANGALIATVFAASLGTSLLFATYDVMQGSMTVGDFVLVNAYVVRLVQPLEMLGYAVRDIAQGVAFLHSLLGLFQEKAETDTRHIHTDASITIDNGELAFEGVSFSYRPDRRILQDVSFRVSPGRTVAVVGASGSGKSSLVRLLFRLYEPDSGHILLDGLPIARISLSYVRQAIAIVPQDTVLFHSSIADNIAFGRAGATQSEIEDAARIANLHDFIVSLPEGYETLVGERGLKLSGGERQRVAIARAALKRPRIFVFDEATSSLDSKTEREILKNLVSLSRNNTTLVIAHRLSTVVHADEIVVLDRGVVVERGTHDELRALNSHYAALWNAQQAARSGQTAAAKIA